MGRTHINLLSTQKNLLADYVRFRGGVSVCVCAHSIFPRSSPGSRTKEKDEVKKKVSTTCM